jgi:glucokinase
MILAGDIGGTKVNFGLFELVAGELKLEHSSGHSVQKFDSFESALEEFLKSNDVRPQKLCVGAAGPVSDGRCRLTNASWELDTASLKTRFGFSEVLLVNDLAATAASLPLLKEADLVTLQPGETVSHGRMAVMSSGTGLGQGFLIPDKDGCYQVLDTEGGQCGLAPNCPEEFDLFSRLSENQAPLSIEDVLSGQGLERIYRYYLAVSKSSEENKDELEGLEELTASKIVEKSCTEDAGLCSQTVDRFVSILGAVAGDMALQLLARGGVYIGGGIPPKILERMKQPFFLENFQNKKKFQDFMKSVPVYLITNELAPLWGAAGLLVDHRVRLPAN